MAKRHDRHGRLLQSVVGTWFPADRPKRGITSRDEFASWLRARPHLGIGLDNRRWSALKTGHDVPWDLILALRTYLREVKRVDVSLDDMARESKGVADTELPHDLPFSTGWSKILPRLLGTHEQKDLAFCSNAADILLASEIVMQRVGRAVGGDSHEMTHSEAVRLGEQTYERTSGEYAKWLNPLHRMCKLTIMFGICRDSDGDERREGVAIMLPVTAECYAAIKEGRMCVFDIRPEHLEWPTAHLLTMAMCETYTPKGVVKSPKMLSTVYALLYQLSLFSVSVSVNMQPNILTFVTNKVSSSYNRAYRFFQVSSTQPPSAAKIHELTGYDHSRGPLDLGRAMFVTGLVAMHQIAWREDSQRWSRGIFPPHRD